MSGPGNPTTSGTTSYNQVATEIITDAYRIIGVINEEEDPSAGQFRTGMIALNSWMKEQEASGIHVWTEEEAILFFQQGQYRYLLGGTNTDNACAANDFAMTTLASSAAAAATSISVVLTTDMEVGDYLGVVLDTGAAYWTTIRLIAGTTVYFAIGDSLPSSASQQNFVFAYTTKIIRPLRIPAGRRVQYQGFILTPLTKMMSRQEYMDLPQPQNLGTVTQAFYNPGRDQGELYVWNNPSTANNGLRFTWYRPLQDFLTADDAPDMPQEWINCLDWNLALELCPRYSVPAERWDRINAMAKEKLDLVRGWDREFQSVYFGLSYDTAARY